MRVGNRPRSPQADPSNPLLAVEGYVSLRLPAARSAGHRFIREPQSERPVRVLVNPETHLGYWTADPTIEIYDEVPPFSIGPLSGSGPSQTIDPPVKSTQGGSRRQ